MSETGNRLDSIRLPVKFEQQRGVVRFSGAVDANRIFALCDEIDSLIDEYYYSRIRIEIDSTGGEVKSLLYFCEKLKKWRKAGVRIETKALTLCASAAALMLSMGERGYRTAMPKTKLVYHNARVTLSQNPFTSDVLDKLSTTLSQTDTDMLVTLMRHLYGGVEEGCFRLLETLACKLPFMERKIDVAAFKLLNNAKINRLASSIEKTDEDSILYRLRVELHYAVRNLFKVKQPECTIKHSPASNEAPFPSEPAGSNEEVVAWLLQRFEHFRDLFTQDITICPEAALSEGLIDTIEG
jgi:ATP-dependent protease ClpP protease subunit